MREVFALENEYIGYNNCDEYCSSEESCCGVETDDSCSCDDDYCSNEGCNDWDD